MYFPLKKTLEHKLVLIYSIHTFYLIFSGAWVFYGELKKLFRILGKEKIVVTLKLASGCIEIFV
jgi:hypothetical protein